MLHWDWLTGLRRGARFTKRRISPAAVAIETLESRQLLTVASFTKIASGLNGGPTLVNDANFGKSVTAIGDLDGDGVTDLAVGADRDDTGGNDKGALYILFMNTDGSVKSSTKIADATNGGPTLGASAIFGTSVTSLGDIDGDTHTDLAVGAAFDGTGGSNRGAVYIVFLNADGTAKATTKIASSTNGGPALSDGVFFGTSVAAIGDLNGDTITDIAVGAISDATGGAGRGAVYVMLLNANGTAQSFVKIASGTNGGPTLGDGDLFGASVTSLGTLDGDNIPDIAVGATHDDTGANDSGAVHILFLNADGTVKSTQKIANQLNGGPTLETDNFFGTSVAGMGDLDGDGIEDLTVGAYRDNTGGNARGAAHVLFLNADGTVKNTSKIASGLNGSPTLANGDLFGASVASIGDFNNDGAIDLAVGAIFDDTAGGDRGALHLLFQNFDNIPPVLALGGFSPIYVKNNPPVPILVKLAVSDANSEPEFQIPGGQVIVTADFVANKKLTKIFDQLTFGTFQSLGMISDPQLINGRGQVTINLSDSATLQQIIDAFHAVTFTTSKKGLKVPTRQIDIQVIDKAGGASNVITQTVHVSKKRIQS